MEKRSYIHIYCGDGKGKTTSALGLCIRAAGAGKLVYIYQFMKDNSSSEINTLNWIPNITRLHGEEKIKFSFLMTQDTINSQREKNNQKFLEVVNMAKNADVLFLDEVVYAIGLNLLSEELVIQFLKSKPKQLEVILTGQGPSMELLQLADYVSEIKKLKHPFDNGLTSRKSIEY